VLILGASSVTVNEAALGVVTPLRGHGIDILDIIKGTQNALWCEELKETLHLVCLFTFNKLHFPQVLLLSIETL
jgi:hypothetical protein